MNISHEHKMIWLSPEMSGTDNVSPILEENGFLVLNNENDLELLQEYPEYKVICGMRNPYERVFLIYLKCELDNILVKKDHFEVVKVKFNEWIEKILTPNKLKVGINESVNKSNHGPKYLKKWVFSDKIPDFFVKTEDLSTDLKKLGFKFKEIDEAQEKNQFNFNQMYHYESAKRVYHLYKKHFYLCDYDPFSFTTEELEDYEKIDLIHDIL